MQIQEKIERWLRMIWEGKNSAQVADTLFLWHSLTMTENKP
jgi:hypothetical protein